MPKIIMKVSERTGEIRIEAEGFTGTSCAEATQFLKDTLGECKDFQEKAEWFEENISHGLNTNLCG